MSKILIIEDCTKCPNFIPCNIPLNFINNGGFPVDCPLSDYEESEDKK